MSNLEFPDFTPGAKRASIDLEAPDAFVHFQEAAQFAGGAGANGFELFDKVQKASAERNARVEAIYKTIYADAEKKHAEELRKLTGEANPTADKTELRKGSPLTLFMPLCKIDEAQHLVWGVAASETPDRQGEVLDYAGSKPNFQAWSDSVQKDSGGASKGNVREMHSLSAVGTLTEINFNDAERRIEVCAKITDAQAWAKVITKTYLGFSIGGRYERTWSDSEGLLHYVAIPHEISLVDRPAVPDAIFSVAKIEGVHKGQPKQIALET
jgi:hypothetical protein